MSAQKGQEGSAAARHQGYLEAVAKALPIVVVLLPAAGVLSRYVSLAAGGVPGSVTALAWKEPLPELAITGIMACFPALSGLAIISFGASIAAVERFGADLQEHVRRGENLDEAAQKLRAELESVRVDPDAEKMATLSRRTDAVLVEAEAVSLRSDELRRQQEGSWVAKVEKMQVFRYLNRLPRWTPVALVVLVELAQLLWFPAWPAQIVTVALFLILYFTVPAIARWFGTFGAFQAIPLSLTVILLVSIASGLAGTPPGVVASDYAFEAGSNLPDGKYVQVGVTSDEEVLQRCSDATLFSIKRALVRTVAEQQQPAGFSAPSLWGVSAITQKRPVVITPKAAT